MSDRLEKIKEEINNISNVRERKELVTQLVNVIIKQFNMKLEDIPYFEKLLEEKKAKAVKFERILTRAECEREFS